MKRKWEIRTIVDGQLKIDTVGNDYNEEKIKSYIKEKYQSASNVKIVNISGAFDPIPGKRLLLGTHGINSSLNLELPYAKSGNKFYELIDPELENLRLIIEKQPNTENARNAIIKIEQYFRSNNIGMADIIDFCTATGSKDTDISLNESIIWNERLVELLSSADIVILNGKTKSKTRPCTFMFLQKYLNDHGMRIDKNFIYVGDKKIKYTMVYSSSNGVYPKYYEARKKEWNSVTK